jgi:hypothetical protein
MDTLLAFRMGEANRGKELKVFDWNKAARLIIESNPEYVKAGLAGDWGSTGGTIWSNGKPVPSEDAYVYLASTWATPEIEIDGEIQDCYKMQSETDKWDAGTYWPESALQILKGEDK